MAETLGNLAVQIGLDSTGFQNGIGSINRNLRVLDSEFKANTASLGENGKGLDGLRLKSENISKSMDLQKQKITALESAYNKSVEIKGKDAKATQEIEIKLNKAKQALSNMETELSKTNKQISVQGSGWTSLGKKLDTVGSKMKTVGEGLKSVGTKFSLALTAPLVAAGTASVKLASDTSESMNKVEVAFKNNATQVESWSKTTLSSYGIAQGSALDMAALFGDMGTAMGQSTQEASKMSMNLVGLAGDLASFKNIGIDQAQDALKGIFTGEGEALKSLGVIMQDSTLEAYALATGQKKQYDEMTQAEKVALRYSFVMSQTKNAQGDFARTSDGTANQMRIFQESLKELGATMGQNILPVITPIIAKLNEWVQSFGKLDQSTQKTILIIGAIVAAIAPVLVGIGSLITAVSSITTAFGAVSTAIGAAGGFTTVLTGTILPIAGVVAGIGALVAIGVVLYKNWDKIKAEAQSLWTSITTTFQNIKTSIIDVWENVKTATLTTWENLKSSISNSLNNIKSFLEPALNFYKTIFENTWNVIKNIVLGAVLIILDIVTGNFTKLKLDIENIWNNIKTALTNIWEAIKNTAINAWTKLKETVINLCNNIKESVVNIWNSLLSWFAGLPSKLYTYGANMFTRMKDGVNSTIGNVKNAIESGIKNAISFITSLPSKAFTWGVDFIDGLVNGIKSAVGKVEDAVSGVADKIRSFLHFSVPDEGALTDYETWMPDFMSGLAQGINKNKSLVTNAIKGLSTDMAIGINTNNLREINTGINGASNNSGNIIIENMSVRNNNDIKLIARELYNLQQNKSRALGVAR